MNVFLALLTAAPPAAEKLKPNQPVVDIPMPMWAMVGIATGILLLASLAIMLIKSRIKPKKRRATGAREIARRALRDLEARIDRTSSYDFSIAVSDILRAFISKQFGLSATQQTSPEFLATIAARVEFSKSDQVLLGKFLERCDKIKFAREEGTENVSAELMNAAMAFVDGGRV